MEEKTRNKRNGKWERRKTETEQRNEKDYLTKGKKGGKERLEEGKKGRGKREKQTREVIDVRMRLSRSRKRAD